CVSCSFFFQAEDGIRDFHVTGVQTCALPIFILAACNSNEVARLQQENDSLRSELTSGRNVLVGIKDVKGLLDSIDMSRNALRSRSEERRVGKGSGSRWRRYR